MNFLHINRRVTITLAGIFLLAFFFGGTSSLEAKEIALSPHESNEIEITGKVDSIVDNEWSIDGILVIVSDQAEVEGEIQVGDMVEIHATPDDDGVLQAREVELLIDNDLDMDDDNDIDDDEDNDIDDDEDNDIDDDEDNDIDDDDDGDIDDDDDGDDDDGDDVDDDDDGDHHDDDDDGDHHDDDDDGDHHDDDDDGDHHDDDDDGDRSS